MKKFLFFLAFSVIMGSAYSQKVAVGGKVGAGFQLNNNNYTIPIAASAEYAFKDNMSVEANIGFEIGPGKFKNSNVFYFSPEFRYYLCEKAFDGFYLGGYFGVGSLQFNGNYISLGATTGYQKMLKENLNLDINTQIGWGSQGFGFGRQNVAHIRPTVGLRYAF